MAPRHVSDTGSFVRTKSVRKKRQRPGHFGLVAFLVAWNMEHGNQSKRVTDFERDPFVLPVAWVGVHGKWWWIETKWPFKHRIDRPLFVVSSQTQRSQRQLNRNNHNKTIVRDLVLAVDTWNGNEVRDEHQDNKRRTLWSSKTGHWWTTFELVNERLWFFGLRREIIDGSIDRYRPRLMKGVEMWLMNRIGTTSWRLFDIERLTSH